MLNKKLPVLSNDNSLYVSVDIRHFAYRQHTARGAGLFLFTDLFVFRKVRCGKKDEMFYLPGNAEYISMPSTVQRTRIYIGTDATVWSHVLPGGQRVCNLTFLCMLVCPQLDSKPRSVERATKVCRRPRLCHVEFSSHFFTSYVCFLRTSRRRRIARDITFPRVKYTGFFKTTIAVVIFQRTCFNPACTSNQIITAEPLWVILVVLGNYTVR